MMADSKRYRTPGPEPNGAPPPGKRALDFQTSVVRRPLEEVMIALRKVRSAAQDLQVLPKY